MKFSICESLLFLLVVTASLITVSSIEDTFPVSKNFFIFERINCKVFNLSMASNIQCRIKYIDRNNVKAALSLNFAKPVTELWIHVVAFFKYNTYQKIATELWDDVCGWLAGRHKSFFLDFLKPMFLKHSNLNHTCPYSGILLGKTNNISVQRFAFPQIMPAGRYRLDINVTKGIRKHDIFGTSIYFAISDHRIEIV